MRSKVSLYEAHNTGCSASFYGAEHHIFASTPMANYSEEGWCRRCRGDEDRLALYALDAIHKTKRTISEHNFSKFRHFFLLLPKFCVSVHNKDKIINNDSPMHNLPTICR